MRDQPDFPVVDENRMTRRQSAENFGMRQEDACRVARRGIGIEREEIVLREERAAIPERADAQLRSLQD